MDRRNGYTVFEDEGSGAYEGAALETAFESGSWESSIFEDEAPLEAGAFEGEAGYESYGSGEFAAESEVGTFEAASFEDEAGYESVWDSAFEDEQPESSGPWENEAAFEQEMAQESAFEDESDQFLPLIGLAASALPSLFRAAAPLVKRLIPVARRAVGGVVRTITGGGQPPVRRPMGHRPRPLSAPAGPPPAPIAPVRMSTRARRETVAGLLRRLARVLGEGEAAAAEAEAAFFSTAESEYEVGTSAAAQEAALTEVLAAEAAHSESLTEAQSMLGAALPVTIRIMGARRACGPYLPSLARANARLVRGLASAGPEQRQLLRVVPTIQRRTIASLMRTGGRRLPPSSVDQIVAGQAARVLGTPRLLGPALLRNHAVRMRTVAAPRRPYYR